MAQPAAVGTEIVERVAALEGVDPLELDHHLYDVIDPDALRTLVTEGSSRGNGDTIRVEFSFHGYTVAVDEGGVISIDDRGSTESNGASKALGGA